MQTRYRIGLAIVIGGSLAPRLITAQTVTGTLQGSVLTTTAEPLPGVVATVRGQSLQGTRSITTDQRGRFIFLALPAGNYRVELRLIGYGPYTITDLVVHLGATTTMEDIRLERRAIQLDEIVVSGARARIDFSTTAASSTLDSARIRALPTGRDYQSLLAIVPAGNPSPYGDGVSFGGATGYDNKYFIDGIHVSNPLSSDGSIRLPYNFVKEVQVITGGYEAEFGRSQGAVVNVVTNSGSNEFHGEAVAFYTGNRLRATPRWGIAERPVDHYAHYDVGLSLGGPIRRDKLWFYAAYNPLFEEKDVTFTGIPTERDKLVRHLFAGKLTWRPARATDLSFTVLGDPTRRDAVEGAEASSAPLSTVTDRRAVLGAYRDGGWATSLQVRQQLGRRVLLGAAVSRLTNVHQVARRIGTDDPANVARIDDNVLDETSGNFGRDYRVNTSRTAAEATLTILATRHTIKLGANLERNAVHIPIFLESFVQRNRDESWTWFTSHWAGHGRSTVPAVYAQDSWEISRRLRANLGLRWEGQFVAGDTGRGLTIRNEFAPRLGLIFQPGTPGTQKLTLSAGRFYEQLPLWSVSALTMPFRFLFSVYPQNPLVDRSGGVDEELRLGSIAVASRDLKGQHYDEVTAGYERSIGASHRIGVRGTVRVLRWALESDNTGTDPEDPDFTMLGLLGNPGRGALARLPKGKRRYTGLELTFQRSGTGRLNYLASYVLSRAFGNLPGEFDSDSRIPASHTQGQTASPNWWEHATGYLPSDRRHLLKLSGSYLLRTGFTAGLAATFGTGVPLSEFALDPPYGGIHIRDRGTNGRTPSTWNVDLRLAYSAGSSARWHPRIVLDLANLGNQRRAIDYDQLHYYDATNDNPNLNYLKVNRYQAPLSARIGVMVGF